MSSSRAESSQPVPFASFDMVDQACFTAHSFVSTQFLFTTYFTELNYLGWHFGFSTFTKERFYVRNIAKHLNAVPRKA
jgi:hypothetical protein